MVETTLLNILKFKSDVDVAEIKQILFATSTKKSFILKNSLKVKAKCPFCAVFFDNSKTIYFCE